MATKRRRRRPSPDESVELGLDGAMMPPPPPEEDQGSEAPEMKAAAEENDGSGNAKHAPAAAAPKPKRKPKRAERPSPPPPEEEDAGAQGSGVAPPVRDPPPDELAAAAAAAVPPPRKELKTKKKTKRSKRPPPPSQEEVEGSGDPSLARDAPADKTAAASPRREVVAPDPDHNNRGAPSPPPKRAKRAAMPPPEEEERAEKRAAGAHQDGTGKPPADAGVSTDKVNKKKKKKKLRKVLPKPHEPTQLGLTGNRGEVPDARNTSAPQEKDRAQKEGQRREDMVEQDDAGDTSPPLMNDGAHEEEEQWEEDAEQGRANSTSPEQEKDAAQEDEDAGVEVPGEAPPERNGSSPKLCSTGDRSWSHDDVLKILTAMVEYAQSHDRALPDSSHLLANLTFDKTNANASKLDDKIRKLRARYRYLCSQRPPTDGQARQLFDLSHILWGKVDNDVRVEESRDFSQLSELYPYLAKEIKVYAETLSSGHLIMAAFTTIGDEKARHLDAMCKKQRSDVFNLELMRANLELSQAKLTKAVLSALSSQIN